MSKKPAESVKVVVRCRPLNEKEISDGHESVVNMDVKRGIITLQKAGGSHKDSSEPPREFTFDAVYDWK